MKQLFLFLLLIPAVAISQVGQTNGVVNQDLYITGQASQSASGNNIILATAGTGSTDASGSLSYRSFFIQINASAGISSGQIIIEGSNDNTSFVPMTWYDDAVVTGATINVATSIAASTNRFFSGKISYRYIRCRISTVFAGGTVQAYTRLSASDYMPRVVTSAQATAANLNATVTATNLSTNIAQVGGTNTVNGGVAGVMSVGGNVAHSAAATTNPVQVGGRAITTIETTLANGDVVYNNYSTAGQLLIKQFASSENDWQASTAIASPITNTTATAIKAAGAANVRNYLTGLQFMNTSATASIITIQDGSTVIWTGYMPASMTAMQSIIFTTPLRGSAATALNFVVNTTATNTFVSAQGYQSF